MRAGLFRDEFFISFMCGRHKRPAEPQNPPGTVRHRAEREKTGWF
jgi:hypothetical protein